MFKKYFQLIIVVLFFIIFTLFNYWEYFEYHKNNFSEKLNKQSLTQSVSDFTIEKITDFSSIEIYSTPNKELLEDIVSKIENAQNWVYLEVYMLTEKRIVNSLKKAHKKWLDIKVVLEHSPYLAPKLNDKSYNELLDYWIDVVWSNPQNYYLNHSKIIIIDNQLILSTWNFTHSTFTSNKDMFLYINDDNFLNIIEKIFLHDFYWELSYEYHDNLILSPDYSREKLEYIIQNAGSNIYLVFPYLSDDNLLSILKNKSKDWVEISIVVSRDFYKENKDLIEDLSKNWLSIIENNKYKHHSKAILVDDKILYIGSVNFSEYSFDKNRELWVLISNKYIIEQFINIWNF